MNADDLLTEADIQREIIMELRQRGAEVIRLNAGRGRHNQHLAPPGCPDLLVIEPSRTWFCEVKTPTGRLSQDQKIYHERLERYGCEVVVARGVEDITRRRCQGESYRSDEADQGFAAQG